MATVVDVQGRRVGADEPRAWRLVLGIVMAVIGAAAIYTAKVTGIVSVIMAGTALTVAGFVEVLAGLGRGSRRVQPLRLMGGLLSMIVGVLFVFRPQIGLTGLTMMLAAYFIASGLFHAVTSLLERYDGWGWDLFYGACAIALCAVAVTNMRSSGFWMVGVLVGVDILARGLALTFGGMRRGRHRRPLRSTTLNHA
jgi:uncharacterized membrane protein HdeD (DUF308 family)